MSDEQMRLWLIQNCPYGPSWTARVNSMSPVQVRAVYNRKIEESRKNS